MLLSIYFYFPAVQWTLVLTIYLNFSTKTSITKMRIKWRFSTINNWISCNYRRSNKWLAHDIRMPDWVTEWLDVMFVSVVVTKWPAMMMVERIKACILGERLRFIRKFPKLKPLKLLSFAWLKQKRLSFWICYVPNCGFGTGLAPMNAKKQANTKKVNYCGPKREK